jgi:hypothetical protein
MGLQATARPLGKHIVHIGREIAAKAPVAKSSQDFQHH